MRIGKTVGYVAGEFGKGLLAGFVGTIAINLSQTLEQKVTHRTGNEETAAADAVARVLKLKPEGQEARERLAKLVSVCYGSTWGGVRGLLGATGLPAAVANALHFGAVWGTAMVMLPKLELAPPVEYQVAPRITMNAFHHALYSLVTGWVYEAQH